MKIIRNKILVTCLILSIALGFYLYEKSMDSTSTIEKKNDQVSLKDKSQKNKSGGNNQKEQVKQLDEVNDQQLEKKRNLYKILLTEKNTREMILMKKTSLSSLYQLLDDGLVDADVYIQVYTTSILRQFSIYSVNETNDYLNSKTSRIESIIKLLESNEKAVVENAFSILATTQLDDIAVTAKLINIMNDNKTSDASKLVMVRELGRHKKNHSNQIKEALADVVLGYQLGSSDTAAMIDAALILSQYETEQPVSIFPYICKIYEQELYNSPSILHVFNNYTKSNIGCLDEMQRVVDKIKRNEIKFSQPTHAKFFIENTQDVIDKITGS